MAWVAANPVVIGNATKKSDYDVAFNNAAWIYDFLNSCNLTNHGVLVGSGTGVVTALAVGATGQVLLGATGADPTWGLTTVPYGGTGATTFTDHGIMLGSAAAALTVTAAPTDGQLLIGKTGFDPVLALLTDGTGILITEGAGTITIAHVAHTGDVTGATDLTIGPGKVHQGMIATLTEEVSHTGITTWGNKAFSNVGSYGFYPQLKSGNVTNNHDAMFHSDDGGNLSTSYVTQIALYDNDSSTIYAQIRYVTASGEYGWAFFLKDKETEKIISGWFSGDHPSMNDEKRVHPFIEEYDPDKHIIDCIVLTKDQYLDLEVEAVETDSSPLQLLQEDYDHVDTNVTPWPTEEITLGLPKIIIVDGKKRVPSYRSLPDGTPVESIKKKVVKPEYVNLKGLVKKELPK